MGTWTANLFQSILDAWQMWATRGPQNQLVVPFVQVFKEVSRFLMVQITTGLRELWIRLTNTAIELYRLGARVWAVLSSGPLFGCAMR